MIETSFIKELKCIAHIEIYVSPGQILTSFTKAELYSLVWEQDKNKCHYQ